MYCSTANTVSLHDSKYHWRISVQVRPKANTDYVHQPISLVTPPTCKQYL